ncbi:hypothetical protein [Streptomyces sp. NPDC054786]
MNAETQLPFPRERFYRRERRSVPLAREFVRAALVEWGVGERRPGKVVRCEFVL